jgi:hypothetical protein
MKKAIVFPNENSLEARRRLQRLLDQETSETQRPSAERVRLSRALGALELAGTAPARELLAALAKGAPAAWLTQQAQAGRERLDRRRLRNFFLGGPGVVVHCPPAGQADEPTYIDLVVDGDVVDLNRIPLPADTPIIDERL